MLGRLKDCEDQSSLELNDEQSNEVAELLNAISSSEAGKSKLEIIYSMQQNALMKIQVSCKGVFGKMMIGCWKIQQGPIF